MSGRPSAMPASHADVLRRLYRPRMSTWWRLRKRSYLAFMLRELSSVFVAWAVVFLLLLVRAMGRGPSAYRDFLGWADTPWVVVLNVVTLAFLVYHAITWFNLTPKAARPWPRGGRVGVRRLAGRVGVRGLAVAEGLT